MKEYCIQNNGDCKTCNLCNTRNEYDCMGNRIDRKPTTFDICKLCNRTIEMSKMTIPENLCNDCENSIKPI